VAVAGLYGSRAWRGAEPAEAWFRRQVGRAGLIHLATHGHLNAFNPMSSGVRLAAPANNRAGSNNDGTLQAWELMSEPELRLRAELVVLSACETGGGESVRAE
jgi:CHAT domain-containing protein